MKEAQLQVDQPTRNNSCQHETWTLNDDDKDDNLSQITLYQLKKEKDTGYL